MLTRITTKVLGLIAILTLKIIEMNTFAPEFYHGEVVEVTDNQIPQIITPKVI
jgi:hypothetical protein